MSAIPLVVPARIFRCDIYTRNKITATLEL